MFAEVVDREALNTIVVIRLRIGLQEGAVKALRIDNNRKATTFFGNLSSLILCDNDRLVVLFLCCLLLLKCSYKPT